MRVIDQVLDWRFGQGRDRARILDFASGYGRVTRFLVLRHPVHQIAISDILPGAVAFQQERFGVRGFQSSVRPVDLDLPEEVDLLTVFSLFSHLPRHSFGAWLRRLWEQVAPGGVLVFSTLGERTMPPGPTMPEEGYYFEASSHLPQLAPDEYGGTWVSEAFVDDLLLPLLGPGDDYLRLPLALWAHQDLYIVAKGDGSPLDRLDFRWEPMGRLEECVRQGDDLRLGGWAWDLSGEEVARIDVLLEGRLLGQALPTEPRPDVARHLSVPAGARTGWSLEASVPSGTIDASSRLEVRLHSQSGESFIAHFGMLEETQLWLELERLHGELEHVLHEVARERKARGALWYEVRRVRAELRLLRETLALSRFWKVRNRWWRFRSLLRPER